MVGIIIVTSFLALLMFQLIMREGRVNLDGDI